MHEPGFRPGSRATFVPAIVAKTSDAPSGLIGWDGRKEEGERANSLRSDKARRIFAIAKSKEVCLVGVMLFLRR
jgi:hypothetical protein